jgi:DNA invertase Pin-like site-specific DNA recombinase
MANLMLSVMGAFAEFERALIRERQREGIAIARQRGAYRGRKRSLSDEKLAELHRRVAAGERKAVIARDLGIVKPYTSISARPTDAHVLIMSIKSLSGAQTLR